MKWRCPNCGSVNLNVTVFTNARLLQSTDGENFETEIIGDHEWGEYSYMNCTDCDFGDDSHVFKENEP